MSPFEKLLDPIEDVSRELTHSSDASLQERAASLRNRAKEGEEAEDLLTEAFSLVREASRRLLAMEPFREQMAAGIALHEGKIVEMQTGEGKTLTAVAPAFLNALQGHRVHILTFNDYLARRDASWMGPIFRFLGLTVGTIQEGQSPRERREAYAASVTYATAKEVGFDFLRDQLCYEPSDQRLPPFSAAIVDEADSIMIDEARVPLVIAGSTGESLSDLERLALLAREMREGLHFGVDSSGSSVYLAEEGVRKAEDVLQCGNLYDQVNANLLAELINALHAERLLERDVDYIVREGHVQLVDEFTGRVAEDRHWPEGLQAALEAKEGVLLRPEGTILGSITLQHFLANYERLSGMTATARPSAQEFEEFYELDVVTIPTHKPCVRRDERDRIYGNARAKRRAVVDEIVARHREGRPMLVGTASVAESEFLAEELQKLDVLCQVLNARNDAKEAEIIAEAGDLGAVTISTNMAGRGVDIRLGGKEERRREEVLRLGGLYVMGTNKHESKRIDDQLRGRAGRQGDPGTSRFFVSLEDPLFQRYGGEFRIPRVFVSVKGDEPLEHRLIVKEVARVQRAAENQNLEIRKTLWNYSQLAEAQRRIIQERRESLLQGEGDFPKLASLRPERYDGISRTLGPKEMSLLEKRIALLALDRCWSDHLAEIRRLRQEVHLLRLGQLDPLQEFRRSAHESFRDLDARIEKEAVQLFDALRAENGGVNWEEAGLLGPSATWTYLLQDSPLEESVLAPLSANPAAAALGVLALWPILLPWSIYEYWRGKRAKKRQG